MTITITGGKIARRGGDLHSTEALAQSTATTVREINLTTDVTTLSGGTATGFGIDVYNLAEGTEGQTKEILMLASGEAEVTLAGTATGRLVYSDADDYTALRFTGGKWRIQTNTATLATAT